jgi:hypothetical protein
VQNNQITVKFYDIQLTTMFKQRQRQGPLSGANFDQMVLWIRRNGCDNALNNLIIMEEMLTKTFAGKMIF